MKRILDLETDEEFSEFGEVLDKANKGHMVCTLKQAIYSPKTDTYEYVDLRQIVTKSKLFIQINGDYFYATVSDMRRTEVHAIKELFNIVIQHGTQKYKKAEANDYLMIINIGNSDDLSSTGWIYTITGVQPIFVSGDADRDLTLVFELGKIYYSKDKVSIYDVEYDVAERREKGDEAYTPEDYEFDTDNLDESAKEALEVAENFISNDDILSNNSNTY